jgi:hypothetical protein
MKSNEEQCFSFHGESTLSYIDDGLPGTTRIKYAEQLQTPQGAKGGRSDGVPGMADNVINNQDNTSVDLVRTAK